MGLTSDRNDPCLNEIGPDGQQACYLVLSDEERAKGYVRPVRTAYKHLNCGGVTSMGAPLAETYAADPFFYGATFCVACRDHFPVGETGEFVWVENGEVTDLKVGT